jgi:hypothetical protein
VDAGREVSAAADAPDDFGALVVVVVPLADPVPAVHRVRAWLKAGLRGYALRCTRLRDPTAPELAAAARREASAADDPERRYLADEAAGIAEFGGG